MMSQNPRAQETQCKENLLIQGDNLLALKALLPFYRGRVKCIYIDPPYNTGSAFEQYDDNLEHSQWLSMIAPRLSLLRGFLSDDGSIWVSIDEDEKITDGQHPSSSTDRRDTHRLLILEAVTY